MRSLRRRDDEQTRRRFVVSYLLSIAVHLIAGAFFVIRALAPSGGAAVETGGESVAISQDRPLIRSAVPAAPRATLAPTAPTARPSATIVQGAAAPKRTSQPRAHSSAVIAPPIVRRPKAAHANARRPELAKIVYGAAVTAAAAPRRPAPQPSDVPMVVAMVAPSQAPTALPTALPEPAHTLAPTASPTRAPTIAPTAAPTAAASVMPIPATQAPATAQPTPSPVAALPTVAPRPTALPTLAQATSVPTTRAPATAAPATAAPASAAPKAAPAPALTEAPAKSARNAPVSATSTAAPVGSSAGAAATLVPAARSAAGVPAAAATDAGPARDGTPKPALAGGVPAASGAATLANRPNASVAPGGNVNNGAIDKLNGRLSAMLPQGAPVAYSKKHFANTLDEAVDAVRAEYYAAAAPPPEILARVLKVVRQRGTPLDRSSSIVYIIKRQRILGIEICTGWKVETPVPGAKPQGGYTFGSCGGEEFTPPAGLPTPPPKVDGTPVP